MTGASCRIVYHRVLCVAFSLAWLVPVFYVEERVENARSTIGKGEGVNQDDLVPARRIGSRVFKLL